MLQATQNLPVLLAIKANLDGQKVQSLLALQLILDWHVLFLGMNSKPAKQLKQWVGLFLLQVKQGKAQTFMQVFEDESYV